MHDRVQVILIITGIVRHRFQALYYRPCRASRQPRHARATSPAAPQENSNWPTSFHSALRA
jgi:hypothetical protein